MGRYFKIINKTKNRRTVVDAPAGSQVLFSEIENIVGMEPNPANDIPQRLTNLLNGNDVISDKLIDDIRDTLTLGAYGRVREFLLEIPNRYVHFGDLSLGGVCIYLNEFRKVLGDRASMLVPDGYEELLRHGDKKLYQHELRPDVSLDERVAPLVDMIIRCKTGVEQEKLAWRAFIKQNDNVS